MFIHPSSIHLICLFILSINYITFVCKTFTCKNFTTILHFFFILRTQSPLCYKFDSLHFSLYLFGLSTLIVRWYIFILLLFPFGIHWDSLLCRFSFASDLWRSQTLFLCVFWCSNCTLDGFVDIWYQFLFPASPLLPLYVSDEMISRVLSSHSMNFLLWCLICFWHHLVHFSFWIL